MQRIARYALLSLSMLALRAEDPAPAAVPRHVLSNQGIVTLAEAGYDEDFLIDLIQCKQTRFDTTVEGLAYLAKHAISERIVRYMILSQNKVDSPTLTAPAATEPAPMVVVPARIVQAVVVPSPAAKLAGTAVKTVEPQPKGMFVLMEKHLFKNRWYVVSPDVSDRRSSAANKSVKAAARLSLHHKE